MAESKPTVALLIDYDNLQISYSRDAPGHPLDLRPVVSLAQRFGRLVVARAYAEWNSPSERLSAYMAGVEPAFAPVIRGESAAGKNGKSLADTVMVADGVEVLISRAPDVFVLVTSDKDMIPLARIAKQHGARVVVLGSDLTAVPLRETSDEFFTYRQLVEQATGVLPGSSQPRSRTPRSRPAVGAVKPPLAEARPAAAAQAKAPTESPEATPDESSAEERPARRRRRRGGRGRGRGAAAAGAPDGAEPVAAELAAAEQSAAAEQGPVDSDARVVQLQAIWAGAPEAPTAAPNGEESTPASTGRAEAP